MKASILAVLHRRGIHTVSVTLPGNLTAQISVQNTRFDASPGRLWGSASVIKDAGDDPDVTNGAEICATVTLHGTPIHHSTGVSDRPEEPHIDVLAGVGVGRVTKPGLPVSIGAPAINPVPDSMIRQSVHEALQDARLGYSIKTVEVTISIPRGEELARKTLNARLGIVGGLSILGTTGIVRPVSADAWTATIASCMDVASASGLSEIVLSTGRTSERAVQTEIKLPEEAYVMMGDYVEFALQEAAKRGFHRIHMAAMWAKLIKAAAGHRQTHVRHGALDVRLVCEVLEANGAERTVINSLSNCNTGREVFDRLMDMERMDLIHAVCIDAKRSAERYAGRIPVSVYLIHHSGRIIERA